MYDVSIRAKTGNVTPSWQRLRGIQHSGYRGGSVRSGVFLRVVTDDTGSDRSWVLDEDEHDRDLIRHMLSLTPTQRLRSLSNFYKLHRARRHRAPLGPRAQRFDT